MKLLTVKELSELLQAKEPTIYSWVREGTIPTYKLNGLVRFKLEEIEAWINSSKIKPPKVRKLGPKLVKTQDVNDVINKAIEGVKSKGYNQGNGKPGPDQGLRKEALDGTL